MRACASVRRCFPYVLIPITPHTYVGTDGPTARSPSLVPSSDLATAAEAAGADGLVVRFLTNDDEPPLPPTEAAAARPDEDVDVVGADVVADEPAEEEEDADDGWASSDAPPSISQSDADDEDFDVRPPAQSLHARREPPSGSYPSMLLPFPPLQRRPASLRDDDDDDDGGGGPPPVVPPPRRQGRPLTRAHTLLKGKRYATAREIAHLTCGELKYVRSLYPRTHPDPPRRRAVR